MAYKRMISQDVINSDSFVLLDPAAQSLYIHLLISTDDDGFTDQVAISVLKCHGSREDLDALERAGLVFVFPSGVVAVRHFKANNVIRKDSYIPTRFKEEAAALELDENNIYQLKKQQAPSVEEDPEQNLKVDIESPLQGLEVDFKSPLQELKVDMTEPQHRIEETRTEKNKSKRKKREKERSALEVIEQYSEGNDELAAAFRSFYEMRQKMKRPLTARAAEMVCKKLDQIGGDPVRVLDQSLERGWQGVFPVGHKGGIKSQFDEWEEVINNDEAGDGQNHHDDGGFFPKLQAGG